MADLTFDQLKQNYALLESDLQDEPEKTIQEGIDIDKDLTLSEAFEKLLKENETGAKNLWNESIKTAVAYLCSKVLSNTTKIPNTEITIEDIKNANAGNSFEENGEWVKPYTNVDGDNYSDVRGNDKIKSVLTNDKKLQYTNETINKYIRLLMPQYTRRVEIEDLNRNFWVIGQTIAGISAYLFDGNSPINTIFKSLISEVNQLWENLLYLWSDQIVTDVHREVVYLPSSNYMSEMKFDNFDKNLSAWKSETTVINRLQYLVDAYPKSHLCIIPIVRCNNYYKNYYSREYVLGVFFYDRNKKEWSRQDIVRTSGTYNYFTFEEDSSEHTVIKIEPNKSKIYGLAIDEQQLQYQYYYPLSDVGEIAGITASSFFGGIRITISSFSCTYNIEAQEETAKFNGSFVINFIDYVEDIVSQQKYSERFVQNFGSSSSATATKINNPPTQSDSIKTIEINKGFYLGEIPTQVAGAVTISYEVNIVPVSLPPIVESIEALHHVYSGQQQTLRTYSTDVIQKLAEETKTSNQIRLYTGNYRTNIFNGTRNQKLKYKIYMLNNNNLETKDIGGAFSFNPAFYFKNNLSNPITNLDSENPIYHNNTKDSESKELGEAWNRTREAIYLGAAVQLPGTTDLIPYNNYEFWWTHIGETTENRGTITPVGPHSLLPFYRQTEPKDTTKRGRRQSTWRFYTTYTKTGQSLNPNNWAIKLTEVHMDYAPTTNGGYMPILNRVPNNVSGTGIQDFTDGGKTYHVGGCGATTAYIKTIYSETEVSDSRPTNSFIYNFAPVYIKGQYDLSASYYYFLPIVTMVWTHIFKSDGTYASFIQRRIYSDGHWSGYRSTDEVDGYGAFELLKPNNNYDILNNSLSSEYQVVDQGSTIPEEELKETNALLQVLQTRNSNNKVYSQFIETIDGHNKNWLDFERWPLRGFGSSTREGFTDKAPLIIHN